MESEGISYCSSFAHPTTADEAADVPILIRALHDLATKDGSPTAYSVLHDVQQQISATPLGRAMTEYLPRLRNMLRPALPYCDADTRREYMASQLRTVVVADKAESS